MRVRSATNLNWRCAHCACEPKSGRARCVRATQKKVATHALEISVPVRPKEVYTDRLVTNSYRINKNFDQECRKDVLL